MRRSSSLAGELLMRQPRPDLPHSLISRMPGRRTSLTLPPSLEQNPGTNHANACCAIVRLGRGGRALFGINLPVDSLSKGYHDTVL